MAAGAAQRRAELAIDEAQDVRDEAQRLIEEIDRAMEDGQISSEEARRIVDRAIRTRREADQVVVAAEWTSVGELRAISLLTGRDSVNAQIREAEVRQRAMDVGLSLTA